MNTNAFCLFRASCNSVTKTLVNSVVVDYKNYMYEVLRFGAQELQKFRLASCIALHVLVLCLLIIIVGLQELTLSLVAAKKFLHELPKLPIIGEQPHLQIVERCWRPILTKSWPCPPPQWRTALMSTHPMSNLWNCIMGSKRYIWREMCIVDCWYMALKWPYQFEVQRLTNLTITYISCIRPRWMALVANIEKY